MQSDSALAKAMSSMMSRSFLAWLLCVRLVGNRGDGRLNTTRIPTLPSGLSIDPGIFGTSALCEGFFNMPDMQAQP